MRVSQGYVCQKIYGDFIAADNSARSEAFVGDELNYSIPGRDRTTNELALQMRAG